LRVDPKHTVFARAEHAEEAELFPEADRRAGIYPLSKLSVGYSRTVSRGRIDLDIGGLAIAYLYSARLEATYGSPGIKSFLLFVRVRLAR